MDGVEIGGIYYGTDIQKAMGRANKIVTDSAKRVYEDEYDIKKMLVAIECYEKVLLDTLKGV